MIDCAAFDIFNYRPEENHFYTSINHIEDVKLNKLSHWELEFPVFLQEAYRQM